MKLGITFAWLVFIYEYVGLIKDVIYTNLLKCDLIISLVEDRGEAAGGLVRGRPRE